MLENNKSLEQTLLDKWSQVLNEGTAIVDKKKKLTTAIMLENQLKYSNEASGGQLLNESGYTQFSLNRDGGYQTSGDFHKIAVPMVRRTFPNLIAHEVVGVQPLVGPVGIAFALRFKAGQTYNAPQINKNHIPDNELGYNNVDNTYSGSMPTSAGEALGSKLDPQMSTNPQMNHGLGIGDGSTAKEVNFTIEKQQVEAQTRKLRSRWSLEVAQDVKAMHGIDIEEEMMDILAYEITAEIDREIVGAIRTQANKNAHSFIIGGTGTETDNLPREARDWNNPAHFDGRWEHEKYRNIYNLAIRQANKIAIDTRRGPGNFVIVNPTLAATFEGTSAFVVAPVNTDINTNVNGVSYIGNLDGRMKVYLDTFCPTDEFLIGYKGASAYDAGIIYLPYIQLLLSKATFEDSFNPTIGLMSRYAIMEHMFGAHNYYVRTQITNMP